MTAPDPKFDEGGVVSLYLVGVLYAVLSLILLTRLFYKARGMKAAYRSFAIWVLLGFVIQLAIRSASLFWLGAIKWRDNNVLIMPTILYFTLLFLLVLLWDGYIAQRQGGRSWGRTIYLIFLAILTAGLVALILWRIVNERSMFPHHDDVLLAMDAGICIMSSLLLGNIWYNLRREGRLATGAAKEAALRFSIGCGSLTVWTLIRGVWIVTLNFIPALFTVGAQSAIVPLFYGFQWIAMSLSISLITGPQPKEALGGHSQRAHIADVAYINAMGGYTAVDDDDTHP